MLKTESSNFSEDSFHILMEIGFSKRKTDPYKRMLIPLDSIQIDLVPRVHAREPLSNRAQNRGRHSRAVSGTGTVKTQAGQKGLIE